MKTQTATILAALLLTASAHAATLLPMNYAENASHQLTILVKKGSVDKSFLLDLNKATVATSAAGAVVTISSPSLSATDPNAIEMTFSAAGKMTSMKTHFTAADPSKTVFPKANGDIVFDLGCEALVDNLKDGGDLVSAATHAQEISFVQNGNVVMTIQLDDKRTYEVVMDLDGKVISKKMK